MPFCFAESPTIVKHLVRKRLLLILLLIKATNVDFPASLTVKYTYAFVFYINFTFDFVIEIVGRLSP